MGEVDEEGGEELGEVEQRWRRKREEEEKEQGVEM